MEKIKVWLRNNWSTAILVGVFIVLLISPDAKSWLMRQMISTGIMNAEMKDQQEILTAELPEAAEEMSVQDETGNMISTKDLKGKVVFINFWASWCPPCRAEFPSIQKFYDQYQNNPDVVFLTVNMDEQTSLGENYLKKEHFTLPFLIPAGNIPTSYFNGSLPTTVVLDKTGKIRLHHAGMADYSKASFFKEIDGLLSE
ncbi:MAG: TlpA family protein disulfide reductase [Kaistella sp.]|nr:TlpA family protein disulfide reductase [Kaistella sp.]